MLFAIESEECALFIPPQVTYKDRLSTVGTSTEAEWKPIRRTTRSVPSMQAGMHSVELNETDPSGVLFITRPPDLRVEPLREDHDNSSDDAKMEQMCERIRRVRKDDLSQQGLDFWTALEQLHHRGRYAASVPSLPHVEHVGAHAFTFDGGPQPLLPLLKGLMRFPRPLITWDIFCDAPPAEFRAPAALSLTGPAHEPEAAADAHLAITHQPAGSAPESSAASGKGPRVLRTAVAPPSEGVPPNATALQSAPSQAAASSSVSAPAPPQPLRDPRVANAVSHAGYAKSKQARDTSQLDFEAWAESFPGRVEHVVADRLYIVKLDKADGENLLGLIATQGSVVSRRDEATGEDVTYIKGLWFNRRSDSNHSWGPNPEFEQFMHADERITDELPTESCLLEVEDDDLTEGSVGQKWSKPKLKQAFMKKVRWVAEKYELAAAEVPPPAAKRAKKGR